jgi:hypothetical protein
VNRQKGDQHITPEARHKTGSQMKINDENHDGDGMQGNEKKKNRTLPLLFKQPKLSEAEHKDNEIKILREYLQFAEKQIQFLQHVINKLMGEKE